MKYLRVSLLNGCNFNCFYCRPSGVRQMASANKGEFEKFQMAIDLFYKIGIKKIRFTGGEPTLYGQLVDLITSTRMLGDDLHIGLTTNGLLLDKLAPQLAGAGLNSVNISLDTINENKFKKVTGLDRFNQVLAGIIRAEKHIQTVKLNCVSIKGINDDETAGMIDFANQLGVDIRFIEYMPNINNPDDRNRYISGDDIRASLPYRLRPMAKQPTGAARYFRSSDLKIRVGFINSVSHPFCDSCDRIRLSSDGRLYGCLFSGESIDLFSLMEADAQKPLDQIRQLVGRKKYLGCAGALEAPDNLPSFINLGG